MGKIKYIFSYILLVASVIILIFYGVRNMKQWINYSEVPDVINSISVNNYHYLTVIANSREVNDKEALAREIVHMCQKNAFHSMKFSVHANGYPSGLDIKVYLVRGDFEQKEPFCNIRFVSDECDRELDIKNNADQFHLYLDGNEIAFY